jgi:hypothetical protein
MVDDWMVVGSDEQTRQLNDPSGGGRAVRVELIEGGVISEYGPGGAGFVEKCGWDGVVDEFEGTQEDVR